MTLIHKLALFLVTALTLVLASPTSHTWTGNILARDPGEVKLGCASRASQSAIVASQSNITQFSASYSHKPREIRIYWHVIYDTKTFDRGYLTEDQIHKQVRALNTHFKSADISFKLKKIDYTPSFEWFYWASDTNFYGEQMREKLHQGNYDDLNIYSLQGQVPDLGGYSTAPWDVKLQPKLDGVFFLWLTIPGGPLPDYNQGKILVHQVGHWCGLYHTFEGGCTQPGDFVSDTPLEAAPNFDCPINKPNSCPTGGKDPIHNFMDYTNDPCKTEFTKGQGALMRFSLDMWR